MNASNPAIVAQNAVRRLPRVALLLLCLAYVLPGFFGRAPWGNADITAFGYMLELANTDTRQWLSPELLGQPPDSSALLPYWIGALAVQWASSALGADIAARLPYIGLLGVSLWATWFGIYHLARRPGAQPVMFAFGGEAQPTDYARAIADTGVLAFIACLGVAQLSHETTPAAAQLCFAALCLYGFAALDQHRLWPLLALGLGLTGLTLSGAPTVAALYAGGGCAVLGIAHTSIEAPTSESTKRLFLQRYGILLAIVFYSLLLTGLAWKLDLYRWQVVLPEASWRDLRRLGRFFLWFTWPAWPLAMWTLWRWRYQWLSHKAEIHLALPIWLLLCGIGSAAVSSSADRAMLVGMPALAGLAAFALPTLRRSMAALIDWFTLLFFSGSAVVIWTVWIAMQTGFPRTPANNVARLAPDFEPSFSVLSFAVAVLATLAWAWLVRWRVGKHPQVIWKSLVLPATGVVLSWLLLMTLWLPLLDHARSYEKFARSLKAQIGTTSCVEVAGLYPAQITALRYHAALRLELASATAKCPWLLVRAATMSAPEQSLNLSNWQIQLQTRPRRSAADGDVVVLMRRTNDLAAGEN